jgi:hypothetical protein
MTDYFVNVVEGSRPVLDWTDWEEPQKASVTLSGIRVSIKMMGGLVEELIDKEPLYGRYAFRISDLLEANTTKFSLLLLTIVLEMFGTDSRNSLGHPVLKYSYSITVFKLSRCCRWGIYSSGYFPGVWILKADVSVPSVGSIFTTTYLWRWNRLRIPKRRLLIFRRRGNTQNNIYHFCSDDLTLSLQSLKVLGLRSVLKRFHFQYRPQYRLHWVRT